MKIFNFCFLAVLFVFAFYSMVAIVWETWDAPANHYSMPQDVLDAGRLQLAEEMRDS